MSRLSRWLRENDLYPAFLSREKKPAANMDEAQPEQLVGRHRLAPPQRCDVDVPTAQRELFFRRIAEGWKALGEAEPYWSVLTHSVFRMDSFAGHADEFYDPKASGAAALQAIFARNGHSLASVQTCVELGCGVGRTTAALAGLLPQVIGLDVSAPHLKLAREYLTRTGLHNVELRQLQSLGDLDRLPAFDLFFSEIVLQHNPPPVIAAILEKLFAALAPGGFCVFQVPTYRNDYAFDAAAYIAKGLQVDAQYDMEMHVLPQRVVFRLMRETGIDLIEVVEDNMTGSPLFQSMTFFGRKALSM